MLLPMNSKKFPGTRLTKSDATPVEDLLPVEAVLQLKVNGAAYTTTGVGYNSGFALGRGITLAYQVSQELAGLPVLP